MSDTIEELSTSTLDSYAQKARADADAKMKKGARSKNLEKAVRLYKSAAVRTSKAISAEKKSEISKTVDSWKSKNESENIDEVSKDTLKKYVSKNIAARHAAMVPHDGDYSTFKKNADPADVAKHSKRYSGYTAAMKRINKRPTKVLSDTEKAEAKSKLKDLHSRFDTNYQYTDDHSHWKKHDEIHQQIQSLKKKLGESTEIDEATMLTAWKQKVREIHGKDTKFEASKKSDRYSVATTQAHDKHGNNVGYIEHKSGRSHVYDKPFDKNLLGEAIVVHSSKQKDGKEFQVLSRKAGREFVIQSKKKDGTWHTHDAVGSAQRATQLIAHGHYNKVNEAAEVQTVSITVPAMIRLCEIAKEEIDSDTDLHEMIEALIESAKGKTIDSDMIEKVEGDGDGDEDDMNESFAVIDHNKKTVHVAYSENAAKKKAEELSKSTGKPHTAEFKRTATVKEGEIVSADRKVGKDGRLYPVHRKAIGVSSADSK